MIDRVKDWLASLDDWSRRNRWPRISRKAITGFLQHEALQYAGSMAYFAVLSLFQLLVLGVVVGSLIVGEGEARSFVVEQVEAGTPLDAGMIGTVIDSVIESRGGMTVISVAFLAWGALGIFAALSNGISRVFENTPKRPFVKDKLIGLFLMSLTGVLAVASVAIGIITGILQEVASEFVADLPGGGIAVSLVGLLAPLLLIFLAFWVIYKVVPNRSVGWIEVLPGAVVGAVLFTILRYGFTYYATNIANYDSAFGPISTAITLLVFLYFASIVILLGAEFARAAALDHEIAPTMVANPRLLPVVVDQPPGPAEAPGRGLPRVVLVGGAALVGLAGLFIGRLTKRSDDDD